MFWQRSVLISVTVCEAWLGHLFLSVWQLYSLSRVRQVQYLFLSVNNVCSCDILVSSCIPHVFRFPTQSWFDFPTLVGVPNPTVIVTGSRSSVPHREKRRSRAFSDRQHFSRDFVATVSCVWLWLSMFVFNMYMYIYIYISNLLVDAFVEAKFCQ